VIGPLVEPPVVGPAGGAAGMNCGTPVIGLAGPPVVGPLVGGLGSPGGGGAGAKGPGGAGKGGIEVGMGFGCEGMKGGSGCLGGLATKITGVNGGSLPPVPCP
jgi:hypothetical protein